eukprot:scaffold13461_cov166-Amphora_coffeaeformis.AAC.3
MSKAPSEKLPPFVHAVGGSVGSALALLLLYPLERARIEVQTVVARLESLPSRDAEGNSVAHDMKDDENSELLTCFHRIWNRGELYKGAGPLCWTLAASNFVFFGVNAIVKGKIFAHYRDKSVPPYLSLVASILAGSINVLLTNPLWVTNLRIVSGQSTHDTLWKELVHVSRTLGLRHLWQGTTASLLLVSNPVLQFFCYEQIKALRLSSLHRRSPNQPEKPNLSPLEAFLLGALAKAIATVSTYPLQLAQAVIRMQKKRQHTHDAESADGGQATRLPASKSVVQCLMSIYARDGFRGLYTGMNAKLLQTVLTAAFTFLTYEQIIAVVYAVHQRLALKPSVSPQK